MIWAICVLVDVSKYLDILTLEFSNNVWASSIFTWEKADTASAACPAHPLTFVSCHAGIFSSFPSLCPPLLSLWYFHYFRHKKKLVHEIVVVQWVDSFPCNVVFMIFMWSSFQTLSRRLLVLQRCMRILSFEHQECDKFPCTFFPWSCKALLLASELQTPSAHFE